MGKHAGLNSNISAGSGTKPTHCFCPFSSYDSLSSSVPPNLNIRGENAALIRIYDKTALYEISRKQITN